MPGTGPMRLKRNFLIRFWFLAALIFPVLMQAERGEDPDPQLPENYTLTQLSNGFHVLVIQDTSLPLVHLSLVLNYGTLYDPVTQKGLARLLAESLLSSSSAYPEPTIYEEELNAIGAVISRKIETEWSSWNLSCTSDQLKNGLDRLYEGIFLPGLSPYETKPVRRRIERQFEQLESSPFFHFRQKMEMAVWGNFFTRKDLYGSFLTLREVGSGHLEKTFSSVFHKGDALLIIAGNCKPEVALRNAEVHFGGIVLTSSASLSSSPFENFKKEPGSRFVMENEYANLPALAFSWPILEPGVSEKSTENLDGSQAFLAAGLLRCIIEEDSNGLRNRLLSKGSALKVNTEYDPGKLFSAFKLEILANPDSLPWVWEISLGWLEKIGKGGSISAKAFENAKRQLVFDYRYEKERLTDRVAMAGRAWVIGNWISISRFEESVNSLSLEQFDQILTIWLGSNRLSGGILCNSQVRQFWDLDELISTEILVSSNEEKKPIYEGKEGKMNSDTGGKTDPGSDQEIAQDKLSNLLRSQRIYFELNSFTPDQASAKALLQVAALMGEYPQLRIYIDGHTDTTGDADYNLRLSKQRAEAIKNFLIRAHKIDPERMETRGFGETQPEFPENTAEMLSKNRRVVIQAIQMEGGVQ